MGEVYLAQDTKLDRKVALKILPAEVAAKEDRMRRFVQEAKNSFGSIEIQRNNPAQAIHFLQQANRYDWVS